MIRFSKNDLGLYFAMSLVGGGLGLLAGAFLASRRGRKRAEEYIIEDTYIDDESYEESVAVVDKHIEEEEFAAELREFIEEYEPTQVQLELMKNGFVTMDELRDQLIRAKHKTETAPYSYNALYRGQLPEKPELSDLVSDEDITSLIDGRFEVVEYEDEEELEEPNLSFIYDSEDHSFVLLTGMRNMVSISSLDEYISQACWEEVEPMLLRGQAVYVRDYKANIPKMYKFYLAPSEVEERQGIGRADTR